jgi:ankyrin repeat protein
MYYAALWDRRQAMQVLLQHGADINNSEGTPWSGHGDKKSPLCVAAEGRDYDTVEWMLEQGADATAALEDAAKLGDTTFTRLLLDWGADVKSTGADAIRTALWRCLYSVVHLLLSAGPADYCMSGAQERTRMGSFIRHCVPQIKPGEASALLQAAVQHEHTSFAQMLRSAGAVLTSSASV